MAGARGRLPTHMGFADSDAISHRFPAALVPGSHNVQEGRNPHSTSSRMILFIPSPILLSKRTPGTGGVRGRNKTQLDRTQLFNANKFKCTDTIYLFIIRSHFVDAVGGACGGDMTVVS